MRFLVDAQLPRRPARLPYDAGHDALHTLNLPAGNRTTDARIIATADAEGRIVVTRDADFVAAFHLTGAPRGLLLIPTGNITNPELERLLIPVLPALDSTFAAHRFVELTRTALVVHA